MTRIVNQSEMRLDRPSEMHAQPGLLQNQLVEEYKNKSSSNTFALGQPLRSGQAEGATTKHLSNDAFSGTGYDQSGKELAGMNADGT